MFRLAFSNNCELCQAVCWDTLHYAVEEAREDFVRGQTAIRICAIENFQLSWVISYAKKQN